VGGNAVAGGQIGCAVNATAGREGRTASLQTASVTKRILVAGGGPAGMEAARVAAQRGHAVVLCERRDALGGQLTVARQAPFRSDVGEIADWLAAELEQLGVDVRVSTTADADLVREIEPDAVIVATGSLPPDEPFAHRRAGRGAVRQTIPRLRSSWQVVAKDDVGAAPRSAVVVDEVGHYEGVAVVETLLADGASVSLITPLDRLAPQIEGARTVGAVWRRLAGQPFELLANHEIAELGADGVLAACTYGGPAVTVAAEIVVPVLDNVPSRALVAELEGSGVDVRVVGDAISPRFLQIAIAEGYAAGAAI
jgi:NADPH-dependent 2,4-dienoyl-CoA reductase/sulfur reductase-like enzyme